MTDTFRQQMDRELGLLGIKLSEKQLEQFFTYYEMLVEKNKVMNLTAITDETGVVSKHFGDSLSLFRVLKRVMDSGDGCDGSRVYEEELLGGKSVIDVGTGAGFPGIPLKIAFPGIKLTLLDSLNKRVKFLEEVCDSLGLKNVEFIHGRAEDIGRQKEYREMYDLCVSRAVANLASHSFSNTSSMAFLKVALLAAPIMICGCPVLGIKMMVGSDCIPITADNSFCLSVSTL